MTHWESFQSLAPEHWNCLKIARARKVVLENEQLIHSIFHHCMLLPYQLRRQLLEERTPGYCLLILHCPSRDQFGYQLFYSPHLPQDWVGMPCLPVLHYVYPVGSSHFTNKQANNELCTIFLSFAYSSNSTLVS